MFTFSGAGKPEPSEQGLEGRETRLIVRCPTMGDTRDLGLTFAGGGNRSFYQVGLLERWAPRLLPRLAAVSSVSAGSCMAVLTMSERTDRARAIFAEERRGVDRNLYPSRPLYGERPMPHEGIYRRTLHRALEGDALARLRALPFPLYILCAAVPRRVPPVVSVLSGLALYQLEKKARPRQIHPTLAKRAGFAERAYDARDCQSVDELVDLVLASSSTPPFTGLGAFGGESLLDGSLIDNAPVHLVAERPGVQRTLVLLTRPYPEGTTGRRGERLYVAPTSPVPIGRWDYRENAPIDETLELGRRDAERHEDDLELLLGR